MADLRVGPFLFGFAGAGLAPPAHTLSETLPGPLSLDVCSGAKPRQLEWHLGDKVRVRSDRIDLMRKRVEFALVAQP